MTQYGANIYRLGDLNLPKRMSAILGMSPQPDFVEILTWVDPPFPIPHSPFPPPSLIPTLTTPPRMTAQNPTT